MTARNEPVLWLQLMAIGAIPLELQLLRLILAGSDLGPVPSVERLLCLGIAVVAPAVLLWTRPVDWGSLLLVRQTLKREDNLATENQSLPGQPALKTAWSSRGRSFACVVLVDRSLLAADRGSVSFKKRTSPSRPADCNSTACNHFLAMESARSIDLASHSSFDGH